MIDQTQQKLPRQKLLVGPRLRRLRLGLGMTQARMAQDLGISTSYLNLMERNQRPMSAKVLVRMAEIYDFDMAGLSGSGDAKLCSDLSDALKDPAIGGGGVSRQDVEDIVNISPGLAQSFLRLYEQSRNSALVSSNDGDAGGAQMLDESSRAIESVREFLHAHKNYFPQIDAAAEDLAGELAVSKRTLSTMLSKRLRLSHNLTVRIVPVDVMPEMLRYFDRHSKRINISELMPVSGRIFQMAYHIGMLEHRDLFDSVIEKAGFETREEQGLCRTSLANYFAAAVLMPYAKFLKEAERSQYDIELLSHRFGVSFEQVCHRLTTLQKPDARGIPFFFVRVDRAGNVSKRFSAGRFHFSKFGGACPLWNIHDVFQTPGRVRTQIIEMPDETTYFSIARTVTRAGGGHGREAQKLAIGIGCDIAYAPRLTYARKINLDNLDPTPIGVNCHLCERENCRQRAHAPINRKLSFDERARGMSIFRFEV
ncbi:MAG: short-chain fatty acyl-CoA regulator family protein [Robiginitomaculum sp.]